jgi:hypothetical protein
MTTSVYPRPRAVQPGTPIRFAVGSPTGPRSQVWAVASDPRSSDVYLGPDEPLPAMRLSQHRGFWRLEYTPEFARSHPSVGRRRLISRWAMPRQADGDWRRAVSIVVPTASLTGSHWTQAEGPAGPEPAYWPAAPEGATVQFDIMLGMPGHWRLTSEFAGEVGRTALAGAGAVWLVAHYPRLSRDGLEHLRRRYTALSATAERPRRGWAAEVAHGDGSVVLFDFTSVAVAN